MTADSFVQSLLLLVGWRDGYANGANGIIACMSVAANRVRDGWSGGNWAAVLWDMLRSAQRAEPPLAGPDPRDPVIQMAMQAAEGIFEGAITDRLTNGALYYVDHVNGVFVDLPVGGCERIASVGSLTFYK